VTKLGLKFCDRVTVRDEKSLKEIADWVPPEKLDLAFDLSALMVGNSNGCLKKPPVDRYQCRTLGVSVTSVRQSLTGGLQIDSFLRQRLTSALKQVLDKHPELRVRVMVIRGGSREDDMAVSMELHQNILRSHPNRSEIIPYHPDPTETIRKIVECDAVVATRYHACVLAYLAGCRLFFIAYHRKVHDLAGEIGLSDEACIDMAGSVTEETMANQLERMISGEDVFRARLPVTDAERRAWLSIRALQE
jgi:polysaccharide pyruvyl transferase WcaK-like protein